MRGLVIVLALIAAPAGAVAQTLPLNPPAAAPASAAGAPVNAPVYPAGGYPNHSWTGEARPGRRSLPPDRRQPLRPHHARYAPGTYPPYGRSGRQNRPSENRFTPTIVIDGNAFLPAAKTTTKSAPPKSKSAVVHASQQDQFDSWNTEKP